MSPSPIPVVPYLPYQIWCWKLADGTAHMSDLSGNNDMHWDPEYRTAGLYNRLVLTVTRKLEQTDEKAAQQQILNDARNMRLETKFLILFSTMLYIV